MDRFFASIHGEMPQTLRERTQLFERQHGALGCSRGLPTPSTLIALIAVMTTFIRNFTVFRDLTQVCHHVVVIAMVVVGRCPDVLQSRGVYARAPTNGRRRWIVAKQSTRNLSKFSFIHEFSPLPSE